MRACNKDDEIDISKDKGEADTVDVANNEDENHVCA